MLLVFGTMLCMVFSFCSDMLEDFLTSFINFLVLVTIFYIPWDFY